MTRKTESEVLFETFCSANGLAWEPISPGPTKTADYRLRFGNAEVVFEIEQIESKKGFEPSGVSSRTIGAHVRHKISEARPQLRAAQLPAVLLIHNTVDPLQVFGTEPHDFICGMYGELTVRLTRDSPRESFHGRNAKLRHDTNTSFSGVGHLKRTQSGAEVTIYENVYAARPLPFEALPQCLGVVRVQVEHAA